MVLFQKKWLKDSIGNHIFGVYVGGGDHCVCNCTTAWRPDAVKSTGKFQNADRIDGHQTIGEFALLEFG